MCMVFPANKTDIEIAIQINSFNYEIDDIQLMKTEVINMSTY